MSGRVHSPVRATVAAPETSVTVVPPVDRTSRLTARRAQRPAAAVSSAEAEDTDAEEAGAVAAAGDRLRLDFP